MMRWMRARKYWYARPSILTTVSVSLIAQMCYVPQLFAMETRERFQQLSIEQYKREMRYELTGSTASSRSKQLDRHIARAVSVMDADSYSTTKPDVTHLKGLLDREFTRLVKEVGDLRSSFVDIGDRQVAIDRLDAILLKEQAEYSRKRSALSRLEKADWDDQSALTAVLKDVYAEITKGPMVDRGGEVRKPTRQFPRRQSEQTSQVVSSAPLYQYPWRVASSVADLDFVGDLFNQFNESDGLVDEDLGPGAEDLDLSHDELNIRLQNDEGNPTEFVSFVTGTQEGQLNSDPVKIFEYVRNTIIFEPYFGSMKSAERTFREGRGNDIDQAILLVAMLRLAGVHARFAFGTIEVEIEDAADWLGINEPFGIVEMLRKGGIPAEVRMAQNVPASILIDHVWVNAFVDVEPYRGSGQVGSDEGDTWIPLDPSFKQHSFVVRDLAQVLSLQPEAMLINSQSNAIVDGVNPSTQVGFADLLDDELLSSELSSHAEPLRNYLNDNGLEPSNVYWSRTVSDQRFGLFPITDEYSVVITGVVTRSVPEIMTHRVNLELIKQSSSVDEVVLSLAGNGETAKRISALNDSVITLSYEADTASQAIIDDYYSSNLDPALFEGYEAALISVSPRLYAEAPEPQYHVAEGDYVVQPGTAQDIHIRYFEPGVSSDDTAFAELMVHSVVAGGVHSFFIHGQHIPQQDLIDSEYLFDQLSDDSSGNGLADRFNDHDVVNQSVGRVLHAIGQNYYYQIDRFNEMNAGLLGVSATRLPSIACVSWGVEPVGGIGSYDLDNGPVSIDVIRDVYSVTQRESGSDASTLGGDATGHFRVISSLLSNTVELSSIQQVVASAVGASANRAMKLANEENSPGQGSEYTIVTMGPGAELSVLDTYSLPQALIDELSNLVEDVVDDVPTGLVREGIEFHITSGGQTIHEDDYYSLHVYEQSTGNNAIILFDSSGLRSSAAVPDSTMFDYQNGSTPVAGVDFLDLLYFDIPGDNSEHVPYVEVLGVADNTLDFVDGSVESTSLWYLPAVANVGNWLDNRTEIDSVTLPLSVLMLSQPVEQFATDPVLLNFAFDVQNPASDFWVGTGDGDNDLVQYSGGALRSTDYYIDIFGPDGIGSTPILNIDLDLDQTNSEVVGSIGGSINFDTVDGSFGALESGYYSYRAFAYFDDSVPDDDMDYTEGVDTPTIAVTGSFGVDRVAPEVAMSAIVPQPMVVGYPALGEIHVSGYAYDTLAFDRAELKVIRESDNQVLYEEAFTEPRYLDQVIAEIDTKAPPFVHGDICTVTYEGFDEAGNTETVEVTGVVVDNPPDPSLIEITIDGFDVRYASTITTIAGATLSQPDGVLSESVEAVVNDIDIDWVAPGDASAVQILKAEFVLDGRVISEIPGETLGDWIDPANTFAHQFELPYRFLDADGGHTLELRLTPSLGPTPVVSSVAFASSGIPIRAFEVENDRPTLSNPRVRVSAVVERTTAPSSSAMRSWTLALYSAEEVSYGHSTHDGSLVPLSELEELDEDRYFGTDTELIDESGSAYWERIPHGSTGSVGEPRELYLELDLYQVPLPEGDYWVQLITSYHDGTHTDSDVVWAQHPITIDMSNAPIAEILDTNLPDPGTIDDVDGLRFYEPAQVDSGFFELRGYAYDADPDQAGVEYRVEFRPSDRAIQYPDRYPGGVDDRPSWVAIPPEEGSEDDIWSVVPYAEGTGNSDELSWYQFEGREQYRPGQGGAFTLANLDLTGLRDGEYEIVLAVRSASAIDVDMGRIAISSPAKVGRFTFSQEDISLPSTGFPMSLVRKYDSLNADKGGPFGLGWSLGLFDLEIEVHESRTQLATTDPMHPGLYGNVPGLSTDQKELMIRNSQLLDRSVSLTLPDGNRVTFPFYFGAGGVVTNLYPNYWSPPGYDNMTLETLNQSEHIDTGFGILGLRWSADPFNAPEQHHDISGWKLTLEDGTIYTIRRVDVPDDNFSFQYGSQSQELAIGNVWGKPYVSRIELPEGDVVDVQVNADGDVTGFTLQPAGVDDSSGGGDAQDLIRFVYDDEGRIIAAFGPMEFDEPDTRNWDSPMYLYGYSNYGQLIEVARVETVVDNSASVTYDDEYNWVIGNDCVDCDVTVFEYEGETGQITSIEDPRGLQPAQSFYDESGRLIKTVDQYGRIVEISRDTTNRTETVTDYGDGGSSPISTTYLYDEMGNVVREEHSSGKIVVREYDEDNRITLEHDLSRDRGTEYEYLDLQGSVDRTRVTDPLGNVTETDQRITARGTPDFITTRQILPGREPIVTEQEFDHAGNLIRTVSGDTRVENEYDSKNRLVKTFMPTAGSDGTTGDALTLRTEYIYDNPATENPALLWEVKQYGTDENGAHGETSSQIFLYDNLGRQWATYTVTDGKVVTDVQEYDYAGRVASTYRKIESGTVTTVQEGVTSTWGSKLTTTEYNSIDQAIMSIDHVNKTTTTTLYDLRGNVLETATWNVDFSLSSVMSAAEYDSVLGWLEVPVAEGTGLSTIPAAFDIGTVGTVESGAVVTRTVFNGYGQSEYTSEQFHVTSAQYQQQLTSPGNWPTVELTKTEFNSDGRASETLRNEGKIVLTSTGSGYHFATEVQNAGTSTRILTATEYDALGRVKATTRFNAASAADPVVTEYEYDENDRQRLTRVLGMGEDGGDLVTEYEYDEAGRQVATIDPRDNRVEYAYDDQGRRTRTYYDDPQLGATTSVRTMYDARGRRTSEIDQEGRIRNFSYDQSDRLTGVTILDAGADPDANDYQYEYNQRGDLLSITDPNGSETTFGYNFLGQRVSRTLPGNRTEQWSYDNETTTGTANAPPASSFGKVVYHLDFAGNLTHHVYDDDHGRLKYKRHYANQGSTIPTTAPAGPPDREYFYEYDDFGRLEMVTRSTGGTSDRATAYVYDDFGRVLRTYQPEGIIVYLYHEVTGRLASLQTFDANDATHPDEPAASPSTTNSYTYDELGRLKTVKLDRGISRKWTYHYNDIGSRSALEYAQGQSNSEVAKYVTLYDYDSLGRLTQVENRKGSKATPVELISAYFYTHNPDGRRASVDEVRREYDGEYSRFSVTYGYDSFARLISENAERINNGDGLTFLVSPVPGSMAWDGSDTGNNYDNIAQDEREFERTYVYDRAGNRLARLTDYESASVQDEYVAYDYEDNSVNDGSDRLLGFVASVMVNDQASSTILRSETYTYNANGFMAQKVVDDDGDTSPDWTHTYTPDVEDRLISYTRTDHDTSDGDNYASIVYDYNESGIRVKAGSRQFLIDSNNPTGYAQVLKELTGGSIDIDYALGTEVLGVATASNNYVYFKDGHGSNRQLVTGGGSGIDGNSQATARQQQYDYDAYGEALGWDLDDPDETIRSKTDMLYAGEQWDADLGMQYLRARYYLPGQGVFNRVDPFFGNMDDPQSLHKYAYVHGDPVNGHDPTGLFTTTEMMTVALMQRVMTTFRVAFVTQLFFRLAPRLPQVPMAYQLSALSDELRSFPLPSAPWPLSGAFSFSQPNLPGLSQLADGIDALVDWMWRSALRQVGQAAIGAAIGTIASVMGYSTLWLAIKLTLFTAGLAEAYLSTVFVAQAALVMLSVALNHLGYPICISLTGDPITGSLRQVPGLLAEYAHFWINIKLIRDAVADLRRARFDEAADKVNLLRRELNNRFGNLVTITNFPC